MGWCVGCVEGAKDKADKLPSPTKVARESSKMPQEPSQETSRMPQETATAKESRRMPQAQTQFKTTSLRLPGPSVALI